MEKNVCDEKSPDEKIREEKIQTLERKQLQWTKQMDSAFIQGMLDEEEKGNKIDGNFTSQAYDNIVEVVRKHVTQEWTKDFKKQHLKNRLKTIKGNFSNVFDVLRGASLSGFSWNEETKLIEAEDEVWNDLIKAKPEAAKWKKTKIDNFNDLSKLFIKDRASGAGAETAKETKSRMNIKDDVKIEPMDDLDNTTSLDDLDNNGDIQELSHISASPIEPSRDSKVKNKKRKLKEDEMSKSNKEITSSVHMVVDAIREGNVVLQESNVILGRAYQRELSGDEIYNELQPMGLEGNVMASALIFLADNPKKARLLFSTPIPIRKTVLTKMMGESD